MTVVVDTSVLAAIIFGEEDAERLTDALLAREDDIYICAATFVESAIVVTARRGDDRRHRLDRVLEELGVQQWPVDSALADRAVRAWRRFGKGRHPAGLNYGDCFSYALAMQLDAVLAYKGDDFSATDVAAAFD